LKTQLKVLGEDEKAQIHERTLNVLAETGVQVNTEKGHKYLKDAGADVDENTKIVRFPAQIGPERFHLGWP